MARRDIVVIGASAGGVEALSRLVAELPADFPAAVFVTVHFPRSSQSVLPRILTRAGALEAVHPGDGDRIVPGRIYVAPPDWHLLLHQEHVRLVRGPTENGNRPSIDPMFRSAALHFGRRVIGVVLTGSLDDGTAGLLAIKARGGVGVAQAPEDATFASMPTSAIEHGAVQHVAPIAEMGALLRRLVDEDPSSGVGDDMGDDLERETRYASFDLRVIADSAHHPGTPSPYSCPDCGGVLWMSRDEALIRFRCRVGHAWSSDGLLLKQTETLDAALWTALRALEENAGLNIVMADRATRRGNAALADRHLATAHAAERRAELIREVLMGEDAPAGDLTDHTEAQRAATVERAGIRAEAKSE